ncbi:Rab family GTPase [Candidatus Borrarchaeum sp.]|uniref:Rab family GTPase n=1 Tax=Candidatus Borrarchaeum sp. TaxID=2846742 RepID=UPI00257D7F40|nr:Rab family GTPase [Candidatus Borrarchaeum sp.]
MGIQQVKIAFVGDGSVGKTSLVNSFTGKSSFMEQYLLTIGVNIVVHKLELDDDITINFAIWDMGGQKRFIAVRPTFYLGSQLVVYVFDLTNKNSFDNLIRWLEEVNRSCASHKGIIVGNKVDLSESRVVDFETAKEFAEARGFKYLETSAKDGTGTIDLVELLTDYVVVRPSQKSMEPAPLFRPYFLYMGRA